ncbi:hypothetical protein GCM10023169_27470 [Georgenia halophila]|uniref:Uncharacterized protein n=1 Tax=Georgenia halophila TaxID=620889 RepID=A0ABP8LDU0_9MICO
MSPVADLLPPEAYAWWVPTVGAVLLALVLAWYIFVHVWTNPERVAARARKDWAPSPMPPTLRQRYAAEVDAHHARYARGEYDLRVLHLELSATMRKFASERIGTDVTAWTRGDIGGYDPTRRVGEVLAVYEEPSFAVRSDAEALVSVTNAKEVITRW